MGENTAKPIITVRQGETVKIPKDGHSFQEITCVDIARFALAIYDQGHFFSRRRGLSMRFCRDLNGGGMQGLYITKKIEEEDPSPLIQVFFRYTFRENDEVLYEADLLMDRGKDYEPTVNKGKHPFVALSATIQVDWLIKEIMQYRSDIERLSRSPETLSGWIKEDLEMLVTCRSRNFCRKPAILNKNDLERYFKAGLTLEDLKTRLKCSKCGKRGAKVEVF